LNAPIELVRKVNEFVENQFLPSLKEYFYNNLDGLYNNKVINKELYEKLQNSKRVNQNQS